MIRPVSHAFTGADGNRLVADVRDGSGHPVIFLHGGGQTHRAWDRTAATIAASGMRAISVDLRGHGESAWVEGGNYTIARFGDDVAAVFRQVADMYRAVPSAVGASLGGLSALGAEFRHGPLLHSLVLVDVTPRMNPDGIARIQGFMGERMDEGFTTLEEAAEAIARYLPNRERPVTLSGLRKNLRQGEDGRYRWHWDPRFLRGSQNVDTGARELMQEFLNSLPRLNIPVLLVRGMQSELVHERHAREFVELAPRASYIDVGGAGHMVAGDKNDAFSAEILGFFSGREAA